MSRDTLDTIIVGSGPAGLTAAIYNIRANLKTVVISGNQPGGQLTITTLVDNYPGFPNGVGGVKLMMDMQAQVKNLGGTIMNGQVTEVVKTDEGFGVRMEDGREIQSRAVIIATGAKQRWLELGKERELIGRGVSGCATCDGMFFRDKTVAIVGGGDTACTEADFLTRFAGRVYMIHRREKLRAIAAEQRLVLNNPKIEMIWNTEVTEIVGEEKLTAIKIKNNKSGEERTLAVDGLFVAIGRDPATEPVSRLVERKENGQIVVGKDNDLVTMSSMPGIFAAGDCVNEKHMQAIVAAGDGCRAALDAEKWLKRTD